MIIHYLRRSVNKIGTDSSSCHHNKGEILTKVHKFLRTNLPTIERESFRTSINAIRSLKYLYSIIHP